MFKINCRNCNNEVTYKNGEPSKEYLDKIKFCVKCRNSGNRNPMYGKVHPLKGKKIEDFWPTDKVIKHLERNSKGLFKGHKHSDASKKKTSLKVSGIKNGFYGKKHSQKTKNYISEKTIQMFKDGRINSTSGIETLFKNILIQLNVNFEQQKIFKYWSFDFYLQDYDIYIEIDGDYWHTNPKFYEGKELTEAQKINLVNDKRKNSYMKKAQKKLLRFWEYDIKNNSEKVLKRVKSQLK